MNSAECVRLRLSFPYRNFQSPSRGSALSAPIRKTPDFCQAHSAFHVTWLGFCSLRFTSLRIPIPCRGLSYMNFAECVRLRLSFPYRNFQSLSRGSALSAPIRKTPDFRQAHSAFHVTWLGFCSPFRLRIPYRPCRVGPLQEKVAAVACATALFFIYFPSIGSRASCLLGVVNEGRAITPSPRDLLPLVAHPRPPAAGRGKRIQKKPLEQARRLFCTLLRRGRDSNPRSLSAQQFSRLP